MTPEEERRVRSYFSRQAQEADSPVTFSLIRSRALRSRKLKRQVVLAVAAAIIIVITGLGVSRGLSSPNTIVVVAGPAEDDNLGACRLA